MGKSGGPKPQAVGQVLLTQDTDAWEGRDLLASKEVTQSRTVRRHGTEGRRRGKERCSPTAIKPQALTSVGVNPVTLSAPTCPSPAQLTSCNHSANGRFPLRSAGAPSLPCPGTGTPGSLSPWDACTGRVRPEGLEAEGGWGGQHGGGGGWRQPEAQGLPLGLPSPHPRWSPGPGLNVSGEKPPLRSSPAHMHVALLFRVFGLSGLRRAQEGKQEGHGGFCLRVRLLLWSRRLWGRCRGPIAQAMPPFLPPLLSALGSPGASCHL